jgi:hypothetical protein
MFIFLFVHGIVSYMHAGAINIITITSNVDPYISPPMYI